MTSAWLHEFCWLLNVWDQTTKLGKINLNTNTDDLLFSISKWQSTRLKNLKRFMTLSSQEWHCILIKLWAATSFRTGNYFWKEAAFPQNTSTSCIAKSWVKPHDNHLARGDLFCAQVRKIRISIVKNMWNISFPGRPSSCMLCARTTRCRKQSTRITTCATRKTPTRVNLRLKLTYMEHMTREGCWTYQFGCRSSTLQSLTSLYSKVTSVAKHSKRFLPPHMTWRILAFRSLRLVVTDGRKCERCS